MLTKVIHSAMKHSSNNHGVLLRVGEPVIYLVSPYGSIPVLLKEGTITAILSDNKVEIDNIPRPFAADDLYAHAAGIDKIQSQLMEKNRAIQRAIRESKDKEDPRR